MPVYLDNAATSFPKPETVYAAVDHYQRRIGAAAGRGAADAAVQATQLVEQCRARISRLLQAEHPRHIVFTANATDSLNLALHGLLRAGDRVLTSELEHNSVLRPLRALRERIGIRVDTISPGDDGYVDPAAFRKSLKERTRLVVLTHASNVTGAIQPIAEVGQLAREAGARFLVDAAQTAGHVPFDLRSLPVDLLACAGHKGLLGPLGTGVLYLRPGIENEVQTIRQGGTGSLSETDAQPDLLPDKYEAGNLNVPGLAGLGAGVAWLLEAGVPVLSARLEQLTAELVDRLQETPAVTVYAGAAARRGSGTVSLNVAGFPPQDVASILDSQYGIQSRAGLHCAPGAHRGLRTLEGGGTVRLSVGSFNTSADISAAVAAIRDIAAAAP